MPNLAKSPQESGVNTQVDRLAWSTIGVQTLTIWLIQLALVVLPAIDAYFLSGINSQNIAGYALGSAFYTWWVLGCKGALQGVTFAVAPLYGKGDSHTVVNLLIQSLWLIGLLIIVAWLVLAVCGVGIDKLAIGAELKTLAVQYLQVAGFGLPAIFGVRVLAAWLEGIAKPISVAVWFWSAMAIKVGLTYMLLNGFFGSQWQNTTGTALSTNLFYWVIFLGLLAMTWQRLPRLIGTNINFRLLTWRPDGQLLTMILAYGLPIAMAYLMEFALFPTITSLLAVANEKALVAHEIVSTVYDLLLSLPIAFAIAMGIWVGQHQDKPFRVRPIHQLAQWLVAGFMVVGAGLLWLFADNWITHYTTETLIQGLVVACLPAVLVRGVADGLETLVAFEMRAIDRGWTVVIVSSMCLWAISVGGIWWGQQAGWLDVKAVWYWLAVGYGVAWILLKWRFKVSLR